MSFRRNRIKNGRGIVKNSASAVILCKVKEIKVENLRVFLDITIVPRGV